MAAYREDDINTVQIHRGHGADQLSDTGSSSSVLGASTNTK